MRQLQPKILGSPKNMATLNPRVICALNTGYNDLFHFSTLHTLSIPISQRVKALQHDWLLE
jgi:hypothetical protein